MAFVQDTFTDTDGTLLSAHTPDVGSAPTKLNLTLDRTGTQGNDIEINTNRARSNASAGRSPAYRYPDAPAAAEYDILFTIVVGNISQDDFNSMFDVGARLTSTGTADADVDRYYAGYIGHVTPGSRKWRIGKVVAGTKTELASLAANLTVGQSYECKFEIRDATKKLYVKESGNWVEKVSTTDNAITQVGRVGLNCPRHQSNVNAVDDLVANDLAAVAEFQGWGVPV